MFPLGVDLEYFGEVVRLRAIRKYGVLHQAILSSSLNPPFQVLEFKFPG